MTGLVEARCGCNDGKRKNLVPAEFVGTETCLTCGKTYTKEA